MIIIILLCHIIIIVIMHGVRSASTMRMVSFHITPPESFNFTQDDWPKWIRHFERYRQGSGLKSKAEEHKVNALIYIMGDKVDNILCSFSLKDSVKKIYNTVRVNSTATLSHSEM